MAEDQAHLAPALGMLAQLASPTAPCSNMIPASASLIPLEPGSPDLLTPAVLSKLLARALCVVSAQPVESFESWIEREHRQVPADRAPAPTDPRITMQLERVPIKIEPYAIDNGLVDTSIAGRFEQASEGMSAAVSGDRRVVWCPACCRDRPRDPATGSAAGDSKLVYARGSSGDLYAACLDGCSVEALAHGAAVDIREHEAERALLKSESARLEREAEAAAIAAESDLLAEPARAVDWLIPGLVPAQATTVLVGASGAKKTWLLIHAAICVAAGIPFLGRAAQRGRVLLLLLEDHEINRARIEPIALGLGTTLEALNGWLDVPRPSTFSLKADSPSSMAELGRRQRVRGYSLIGIDNISEVRSSASQSSESDATTMGLALQPLKWLASDGVVNGERVTASSPAIFTLHHANKNGDPRGSTAIQQHSSYMIQVEAASQKPDAAITIDTIDGCRVSSPGFAPIKLRYRGTLPKPVVPELADERKAAPAPKLDPRRARILAALSRERGMKTNELCTAVGGRRADVIKERGALEADGLIEERDGLWYLATP